jgi:hypothetical protein
VIAGVPVVGGHVAPRQDQLGWIEARKVETRRQDADDEIAAVVNGDTLAEHRRASTEAALPRLVRHDEGLRRRDVVGCGEEASQHGGDAKHRQEL